MNARIFIKPILTVVALAVAPGFAICDCSGPRRRADGGRASGGQF